MTLYGYYIDDYLFVKRFWFPYNKEFAFDLNVVIILKINLLTNAQTHVVLFSTDLEQAYGQITKFYSLRFQIEFNFRDAKQYWGLEDFTSSRCSYGKSPMAF